MNESQLTRKILKAVRIHHPDVWIYKTNDRFTSGIPDLIGSKNGRFFAIEIKIPKGKLSKIQAYVLEQIINSGAEIIVAHSVSEVMNFLKGGD